MEYSGNMSLDAPESAQNAVLEFFYSAILLVCTQMMSCYTEWRSVHRNLVFAVVPDGA